MAIRDPSNVPRQILLPSPSVPSSQSLCTIKHSITQPKDHLITLPLNSISLHHMTLQHRPILLKGHVNRVFTAFITVINLRAALSTSPSPPLPPQVSWTFLLPLLVQKSHHHHHHPTSSLSLRFCCVKASVIKVVLAHLY